jgi:DNA-directed RNA polymerase specialized sigma24 family protein
VDETVQENPETGVAKDFDPEGVSILLIGNQEEQNEAIHLIDKHLRRVLFGVIRRAGLSLTADEVREVYQEVLLGIWQKAKKQQYNADEPLLPLLFTIARRKAIDRVRKKSRKTGGEQILDAIAEILADTKVGEVWRNVVLKHDGRKMMEAMRNAIVRMPERQRLVASVVMDLFPETPTLQQIQEEVRRRTGVQLTVVAIKSAWREARKKIGEQLVRAGYMERDHGDIE